MATRIQWRRDTAADWTSVNPVLAEGEAGVEIGTGKFKLGDGATAWADLEYAAMTPGEVDTAIASGTFRVVGSGTTPETNAAAARPSGTAPVYWMMANGVTPSNAVAGDIIWNAA